MSNKSVLAIGSEVYGYTIERLIGSGSFANVYLASKTNVSGKHQIAIKHIVLPNEEEFNDVLRSMEGSYPATKDHFSKIFEDITREISTFKTLSSKSNNHIITYYDNDVVYSEDPLRYDVFIKMEYVTPIIKQQKEQHLTVREILKIAEHILQALKVCHQNGVIHRDIKDDNLFINADGMYKIGDFGVSTVLEKNERAKTKKGTMAFIAPEIMNNESYDYTIDLYSLGIVLYKFLNGNRLPFLPPAPTSYTVEDIENAVQRRINGEILPTPVHAPSAVAEIIQKACATRDNRYNNALEMLHDIERVKHELTEEQMDKTVITLSVFQTQASTAVIATFNSEDHQGIDLFNYEGSQQNIEQTFAKENVDITQQNANRDMGATFGVHAEQTVEVESNKEEKQSLFGTNAHRISNQKQGVENVQQAPIHTEQVQANLERPTKPSTQASKTQTIEKGRSLKKGYTPYIIATVVLLGLGFLVNLDVFIFIESIPIVSTIFNRYILLGLIVIGLIIVLFGLGKKLNSPDYSESQYVKYKGTEAVYKLEKITANLSMSSNFAQVDKEQLNNAVTQLKALIRIMRTSGDFGLKNEKLYQVERDIANELDALENAVEVFISQGTSNGTILKNVQTLQVLLKLKSRITK